MPQPLTPEALQAATLNALRKVQADHELHRQKSAAERDQLRASIATLEKWKADRETAATAATTGTRHDDGAVDVTTNGETFRIAADGTITKA